MYAYVTAASKSSKNVFAVIVYTQEKAETKTNALRISDT